MLAVNWELDRKVTWRRGVRMTFHRENEVSASIRRHVVPGFLVSVCCHGWLSPRYFIRS